VTLQGASDLVGHEIGTGPEILLRAAERKTKFLAGPGWGGMPEPIVRGDIEAGKLVRLDLSD
jgi:hypothetical protein